MSSYTILYGKPHVATGHVVVVQSDGVAEYIRNGYVVMTASKFETEFRAVEYLIKANKKLLAQPIKDAIDEFLSSTQAARYCLDIII